MKRSSVLKSILLAVSLVAAGMAVAAPTQHNLGSLGVSGSASFEVLGNGETAAFDELITFSIGNGYTGGITLEIFPGGFNPGNGFGSFGFVLNKSGAPMDFSGSLGNPNGNFAASGVLSAGDYSVGITGAVLSAGGNYGLSYSISPVPVPEPETYAMFLAGLGIMGAVVRRRAVREA